VASFGGGIAFCAALLEVIIARLDIVDLGSGYGVVAQILHSNLLSPLSGLGNIDVGKYIAVDSNEALLPYAVQRAKKLGFEAEGFLYNVDTSEGIRPDSAIGDLVIVSFVLTHLRCAESGVKEAARLVKETGIVLIIDGAYSDMIASGDEALLVTVQHIKDLLNHNDFNALDDIASRFGLFRLSGLEDISQHYGPRQLNPKMDALGFVANFDKNDPARISWERISGGELKIRWIRRAYRKALS